MRLSLILTATGAVFSQITSVWAAAGGPGGVRPDRSLGGLARERGPREAVQSRSHCARSRGLVRNHARRPSARSVRGVMAVPCFALACGTGAASALVTALGLGLAAPLETRGHVRRLGGAPARAGRQLQAA